MWLVKLDLELVFEVDVVKVDFAEDVSVAVRLIELTVEVLLELVIDFVLEDILLDCLLLEDCFDEDVEGGFVDVVAFKVDLLADVTEIFTEDVVEEILVEEDVLEEIFELDLLDVELRAVLELVAVVDVLLGIIVKSYSSDITKSLL